MSAATERPNIVFIVADDLGWADVGCYGADLHETPNIDRLAEQGIRFTDAYAAAPVCTPTRASIMTGKTPARMNMTVWSESAPSPPQDRKLIPPVAEPHLGFEHGTYAEVMQEAYFMAHVGKWHLGTSRFYPEARGFHTNIGGMQWGCPPTFFYPYRGTFSSDPEFRYVPGLDSGNEDPNAYLTDRLTDEALKIIENVKDRPFFLNLNYYTVHVPIEGKPEYTEYFQSKLDPSFHHQNPGYAAMVKSLDENVGRVLAKLEELGIAERTIVFFTSDNGGYLGKWDGQVVTTNRPLRSGKGAAWEGGIRVPLIVRWPGVTPEGTTCSEPVVSTDFYPTFLELSGFADHPRRNDVCDGVSLAPLFRDPAGELARDALYWHYPHYYQDVTTPVSAVRQGPWKLLEFYEDGRTELYNLAEDLSETTDLAAELPKKAEELKRKLADWRDEVGARLPVPNPAFANQ